MRCHCPCFVLALSQANQGGRRLSIFALISLIIAFVLIGTYFYLGIHNTPHPTVTDFLMMFVEIFCIILLIIIFGVLILMGSKGVDY
jgi:hypothetical protein